MSETKIKPRITFGACGCDGARIAGTARASTRTCEHRPSGAGASLAATITEFVVSYIFHLASYTSYIPVSPHEEVRMTARARHFGPLPMVEMRFPLLNGAFRNEDASGHMCVYVCFCVCVSVLVCERRAINNQHRP